MSAARLMIARVIAQGFPLQRRTFAQMLLVSKREISSCRRLQPVDWIAAAQVNHEMLICAAFTKKIKKCAPWPVSQAHCQAVDRARLFPETRGGLVDIYSDVPRSLSTLLAQARSMLTIRVHIPRFASRPADDCSDVPVGSF